MDKIRVKNYMIHFDTTSTWLKFEVYPVSDWWGENNTSGTSYQDLNDHQKDVDEFIEGGCFRTMEGSYCWRGVWEGRIYFLDSEYWSEDLTELSDLFTHYIEPWCKDYIRKHQNVTE